jgi:hypothetical protein
MLSRLPPAGALPSGRSFATVDWLGIARRRPVRRRPLLDSGHDRERAAATVSDA